MKILLFALGSALALAGCYTQIMTYTAYPVIPVRDSAMAADSQETGAPERRTSYYQDYGCNCTPYEITTGLCWCTCDRCGRYHRFGYQYCPTGPYNSYWGWDYYQDYPYWYNPYRDSRYGRHEDYHQRGYYAPSGQSAPERAPERQNLPDVGNRRSHQTYIAPLAPSSSSNPKPSQSGGGSVAPPSSQVPEAPPAAPPDTSRDLERTMNRKRMR